MNQRYLTTFFAVFIACCALTLWYTLSVDAFGIFRNNSDRELGRINQFKFMRSSKPLRLLRANAQFVIIGSSRSARMSPAAAGLESGFNASLPGATTHEQFAMLSMAGSLDHSRSVIIGLDFDAFLSLHPRQRQGFPDDLVQPVHQPAHQLAKLVALKHAFLSAVALRNSYWATHPEYRAKGTIYQHDGSWHRPRNVYKSGDFHKASREKLALYSNAASLPLVMDDYRAMLVACHELEKLRCHFVATPIHLFHVGILTRTGVHELWREWHRKLVSINTEVAQAYQQPPLPLWGFNTYAPAVGQKLSSRRKQRDPWFLDNVHFRQRFGSLMILRMLGLPGSEDDSAGHRLDERNIEEYLARVSELESRFEEREARVIGRLYRILERP